MKRVSRNLKPHTFGNTIFDNFFGTDFYVPLQASKGGSVGTYPATNIINTKDQYLVELSVPGYQKEDFLIEIDKGVLTIAAANKETDDKGGALGTGGFCGLRSFFVNCCSFFNRIKSRTFPRGASVKALFPPEINACIPHTSRNVITTASNNPMP